MQYAPPYYYGAPGQQSPNVQQGQPQVQQQHQQPQQQQPQQHQQQQPQLQMSEHQLYHHHHGIPTYPMAMPPHQPHPGMMQPGGEYNMMTKPKRKQVKNACVNCQKACKKCDDGRPCQRCIKYGLSETCVNSVRKERKKGVKRGPYKRRNQANGESSSPSSSSVPGYPTASAVATAPYQAYANYDAYQSATNPNVGFNNPMQQYVMAMQQQQAMYQNLPYQQPTAMTTAPSSAAATASPALSQHQPSPSTHSSPATTNTTVDIVHKTETKEEPITGTDNTTTTDEVDGSKLNILSQLCSDVLEHPPKQPHTGATTTTTASATIAASTTTAANATSTPDHSSPTPTHTTTTTSSNEPQQQQHTPVLSTPISSSPSSANASPTLQKQEPQMVYPQQQQQQQQPQGQGENNWQGHW